MSLLCFVVHKPCRLTSCSSGKFLPWTFILSWFMHSKRDFHFLFHFIIFWHSNFSDRV